MNNYRVLLIVTPSYKDKRYIEARDIYYNNEKKFHKFGVKIKKKLFDKFKIYLIGFDGQIKKEYLKVIPNKIFSDIEKMPMSHIVNLSLYSNYNKDNYTKNLGYKDKEKALYTIDKIKNMPYKYQMSVVTTMMNRALNHPNKTTGMNDAIRVFRKWIKTNIGK